MFTMGARLHGTYLIYVNYWGNSTTVGQLPGRQQRYRM